MSPQELKKKIEALAPGTTAEIHDLTGSGDHYQAIVVSPLFEGKMMIEQHRLVLNLLDPEVQSGELHALTLKTFAPGQRVKK